MAYTLFKFGIKLMYKKKVIKKKIFYSVAFAVV